MARKKAIIKKTNQRPKKSAVAKRSTSKTKSLKNIGKKEATNKTKEKKIKNFPKKELKKLITKAKKQGYLTYEEINEVMNDYMLSTEQIDETFISLGKYNIKIIDEKKHLKSIAAKKAKVKEVKTVSVFGTVTDPVKMYLREMGLVTLLTREGEVVIAKKIEAGELEVLRALIDTTVCMESIINLGGHIEQGSLRSKYVLRDIDEGDTYIDEVMQTERFLTTISCIKKIDDENHNFREKLFSHRISPDE